MAKFMPEKMLTAAASTGKNRRAPINVVLN